MVSRQGKFQEDLQFQGLRRLHEIRDLSHRTLAKELDISLGSINFCFQVSIEKGWVKVQNFGQSKRKMGHIHLLTPSGIEEKSKLTMHSLKRKMEEYKVLKAEIEILKNESEGIYISKSKN